MRQRDGNCQDAVRAPGTVADDFSSIFIKLQIRPSRIVAFPLFH
jgi:hypothetical protein